jgi:hypothetical protein
MDSALNAHKASTSTPMEYAARLSKIVRNSIPRSESAKNVTMVLKLSMDNAKRWTLLVSIEDAKPLMEESVSIALKCFILEQMEFARKSMEIVGFGLRMEYALNATEGFFHKEGIV